MTEEAKPKAKPKVVAIAEVVPLRPSAIALSDHAYRRHHCDIPAGTKKDLLTDPRFWTGVAARINVGDEIRALAEDVSFRAELLIFHKQGHQLGLKLLSYVKLDEEVTQAEPTQGYDVVWKGPTHKFCIVTANGDYVKKGIADKAVAWRELQDHVKAMNR